ncbi:hypothetical protein SH2C18_15270 [Clostridium sediminicola]|uniref:RHS repeat-associated core domain-containing protein n=1 Tax=Clostridium sediminicola TaxID=3114879 RepID=UPI0031F25A4A
MHRFIVEVVYLNDANGNIETITENGKQIKYYYNELNELIREDNEVLGNTITYTYDGGGNITKRTVYPFTNGTLLQNNFLDIQNNNLYVDGSFELGINEIESRYGTGSTLITDTSNAGIAIAGDKYFYMQGYSGDNYAYINQSMQVTPGKTYKISFYHKEYTQGNLTGDSSYIKLSDGSHVSFDTTLIGDSQWRKMDKMWTCSEGITSIQLRFGFGADDYSWLAVDDIRVQDMGDNNLNSDGSFELGINYIDSRYGIGATKIINTSNAGTARTGDKYFYMDGDEGDNYVYINRPMQVTPGKTYNISFYHKEATTGTLLSNSSYMRLSDGNHVYLDTTLVGDQEWHRMEKTWTCPEGITSIQLRFDFGTDNYSWLAVDDVEIIENNTYEPIETIEYSYDDSTWKDKLTSFNGKDITYDAIGNPLTYDGWTFDWEHGRQLNSMNGNGQSISFKYNSSGIRTEKTVGSVTTKYHLEGDKVTFESDGTDSIYYTYDSNGKLVSMDLNGTEYYYIRNAQGDITGLFDENGIQVVKYNYDSWGKLTPSQDELDDATDTDKNGITGSLRDSIGVKNPYRYRGYRYDSETELYYLQSRYYNPSWGRFINVDDIDVLDGGNDHILENNLFAYCFNNPVNMSDEDGHWPSWATKVLIGAAAIGVGVAVTALTGGAVLPALIAGVKAAATAGLIGGAVGSAAGAVSHRISTGSWEGAGKAALTGAINGAADGFMTGGIMAGASQVASAGFKVAAKATVNAGKNVSGIKLTKNIKVLSPDKLYLKNNGGTFLKVGKTFRIDVGSNTLFHMHFPGAYPSTHFQIGTIGAGLYGGFKR